MEKIVCPALLIRADKDRGGIVGEADLARFKELLPQAEVVHIGGAGHNIRRDQFLRFMEEVQGFLAQLEQD